MSLPIINQSVRITRVSLKQLIQALTYPKIPSRMDLFLKKPTLRAENANLFTEVITITPTDESLHLIWRSFSW